MEIIGALNKTAWEMEWKSAVQGNETDYYDPDAESLRRSGGRGGCDRRGGMTTRSARSTSTTITDRQFRSRKYEATVSSLMPSTAYLQARRTQVSEHHLRPASMRRRGAEPPFDFANVTNNSGIVGVQGFAINSALKMAMAKAPHATARNRQKGAAYRQQSLPAQGTICVAVHGSRSSIENSVPHGNAVSMASDATNGSYLPL